MTGFLPAIGNKHLRLYLAKVPQSVATYSIELGAGMIIHGA